MGSKFQKSNTFGDMKICGFFYLFIYLFFLVGGGGVITKSDFLWTLKVKIQNGNIFLGHKISNIFWYA